MIIQWEKKYIYVSTNCEVSKNGYSMCCLNSSYRHTYCSPLLRAFCALFFFFIFFFCYIPIAERPGPTFKQHQPRSTSFFLAPLGCSCLKAGCSVRGRGSDCTPRWHPGDELKFLSLELKCLQGCLRDPADSRTTSPCDAPTGARCSVKAWNKLHVATLQI